MKRRIVAVMGLVALGLMAATTTPAGAALSSYSASAEAVALDVSIVGQQLTLASAGSEVDSGANASANGAGDLLTLASQATAERNTAGNTSQGPNCSPLTLPPAVPVLDLATGCGSASATIDGGGLPSSNAEGEVAGVGVGVVDLDLDTVLNAEQLAALLDVLGGAGSILGIDLTSTLADLVDAITGGGQLATVDVGPSTSETSVDADSVDATAEAATTVVNLINRELVVVNGTPLPPVLSIEVLPANASVSRSRDTGEVLDQGATPAAVRITVAPDIAAVSGLPGTIEVGTPEQLAALVGSGVFDANGCLNLGGALPAPLDELLCLVLPTVEEFTDGDAIGIEATALELRLLDSLLAAGGVDGGLVLRFANAIAQVGAVVAEAPAAPTPQTPQGGAPALPRTGGTELPYGLALAAVLVAVAGLVAVHRTRPTRT
jgi:hypothetical protein